MEDPLSSPDDSTLESSLLNPPTASSRELAASIRDLRRLLCVTVALLVLLLAALNVYLFHQARLMRRQASVLGQQIEEMQKAIDDYETNGVPWMDRFSLELRRFADAHPDFASVMSKYPLPASPRGLTAPTVPAATTVPTAAKPAPPAKK